MKKMNVIGQELFGRLVVCRCYGAGVHVGVLAERRGKVARLTDARRLWRWKGASTLHEVALHGVADEYTRLSAAIETIVLSDVLETLPVSEAARASLTVSRWGA